MRGVGREALRPRLGGIDRADGGAIEIKSEKGVKRKEEEALMRFISLCVRT